MWADVKTPLEADLPKLLAARTYTSVIILSHELIISVSDRSFLSLWLVLFVVAVAVGHKVDPRETAKKTAVKGPNKKKKRTGARNVSKLTNVHLLEKVRLLWNIWVPFRLTVLCRESICRRITCPSEAHLEARRFERTT